MTPVLRVILPTANMAEPAVHNTIVRGLNSDYITDDPAGNKSIPAPAIYAARMNERGLITVVRSRQAGITAEHTYAGWPIP